MLTDDFIYVGILLACIAFGPIFRSIKNSNVKQWISTILGILVTTIVSGWHAAHSLLITVINAAIISFVPREKRHTACFFFSFFYLLVIFRFTDGYIVPSAPSHTDLILMIMTLRYGGLGYELNSIEEESKNDSNNNYYNAMRNVGFIDVIHYGFSYMGVLTGPFYRYRTYWDCINRNLGDYIDCRKMILCKLRLILLMSVCYLSLDHYFPDAYDLSDELLQQSFSYRVWYIFPMAMKYRTKLYVGMLFSECVCQAAGLGIYPSKLRARSGLGPKNYRVFNQIVADPDELTKEPMDFETIHNVNIWGVESTHSFRESIKCWNMTVQYWMANYVYKQFPYKSFRVPAVFLLSSMWHGYKVGYYVGTFSFVFIPLIEENYIKFYNNSSGGFAKIAWRGFLIWTKFTYIIYLSFAMLLLSKEKVFAYYNSIYWIGHLLGAFLHVIAVILKPHLIPKVTTAEQ